MIEDRRWCPGCGLAVRPATMICPVCDVAIGDGVYIPRDPLDAIARLIDPQRQHLTRMLAIAPWPVLVAAFTIGLGTSGVGAVASCALLIGLMIVTAPASLTMAARGSSARGRRNQEIERQDIAAGPPGAWRANAYQRELGIDIAAMGGFFYLFFGVLVPVIVLTTATVGNVRVDAAVVLAWVALVIATVFRSRRKSDAEGFTGIGVPME